MRWYGEQARDLPWRRSRDPYAVWVSEIMLQQTQVATVVPYFERFLAEFPTIEALAAADEQAVLRRWEGLGYYRRARQLHEAAKRVVADHGAEFPRDPQAVRRLPGIGRYTAGAILSIAFDARQPILEANTQRLLARLLAYRGDPTSAEGSRLLWSAAEAWLPRRNTGRFNQALMELGSLVCLPRGPRCAECPVAAMCKARASGAENTIPPPKVKPNTEHRHEAAVIVRRGAQVLLLRCKEGQRWAGLWDFPRFVLTGAAGERGQELIDGVQRQAGVTIRPGRHLTTVRHGVTRFRITLECYDAAYLAGPVHAADGLRWLTAEELPAYPLNTTGRKLSRLVRADQ